MKGQTIPGGKDNLYPMYLIIWPRSNVLPAGILNINMIIIIL